MGRFLGQLAPLCSNRFVVKPSFASFGASTNMTGALLWIFEREV